MPLTFSQIEQIAAALCPLLRIEGVQWPQPFEIDLHASSIPLDAIDEANEQLEEATGFGFSGHPNGPGGKHIIGGYIEIAHDERGCIYRIAVTGGHHQGFIKKPAQTVLSDWHRL